MSDLEMIEYEKLDAEIERLLVTMSGSDPTSDEYPKMVDQLTKLMKAQEVVSNINLKIYEAEARADEADRGYQQKQALQDFEIEERMLERITKGRISKEVWLTVGANLVGIAMIIGYERANVIASKALGFVMRAR